MDSVVLHPLDLDWHGVAVPGRPRWALSVKDGVLALQGVVSAPPVCIAEDNHGRFVEGLWESDVIELFLLNPQTGFYMEFNLGPRGAWWRCDFDSPRNRVTAGPGPLEGVTTRAAPSETAWDSTLTVSLKSLPQKLAFDASTTKGNITFCLGRPQQFVSLANLGGGTPDFHRPDRWIALSKML